MWFVIINAKRIGPLPEGMLARMVETRTLRRSDLIWRAGLKGWVRADRALPSLFERPDRAARHRGSISAMAIMKRVGSGITLLVLLAGITLGVSLLIRQVDIKAVAETVGTRIRETASEFETRRMETEIQTLLGLPGNAGLRRFLDRSHQLPTYSVQLQPQSIAWTDDRNTHIAGDCGFSGYRDPDVPAASIRVRASIDMAAADALESHFGAPEPIPGIWTRADLPHANQVVTTRRIVALRGHGVILDDDSIGVDHAWLVASSAPILQPMAQAAIRAMPPMANQRDRDPRLVALVSLVQCGVPYRQIPQRPGWENFGIRTPAHTLLHGGDCDSKSLLLATLIRSVMPELPLVLIHDHARARGGGPLEPHMRLGLGVTPAPCDTTVTYRGRRYVVVETTDQFHIGHPEEDFSEARVVRMEPIPPLPTADGSL